MTAQLNNMIVSAGEEEAKRRGLLVQRIVVCVVFVVGGMIATQHFAYTFGFDRALGWHYHNMYFPVMFVWWAVKWHGDFYDQLTGSGALGCGFICLALLVYLFTARIASRAVKGNKFMHGSAHWATRREIKESGVLGNNSGVYVGAWQDERGKLHYLRDSGPSHVLCFAPTRSGKGVGLVLPTLLSWEASTLITDLKGELWELTAGWRQKYAKNKVIRFEPGNPHGSARWNPFDEIRLGSEYEASDISSLARIIVDPEGKGLEDHWARTAHDLLSGCIAHLLYKREKDKVPANMYALDYMLADPKLPLKDLFEQMTKYEHTQKGPHPIAATSAAKILTKPDNERGSVISTVQSHLEIYRDPVLAKNLSMSDFRLFDLMNHETPVSLYLITTPDNKDRLRPLLRMIVNWFLQKHTSRESLGFKDGRTVMAHKHRLLFMGDEFPSLGKLPAIADGLAFIAGYGIKCYLITQDLTQLYQHYTKEESVTSNCHIQVAFPPNKVETAEYLSKLCGETTVLDEQYSTSGKRAAVFEDSVSHSIHSVKRALLTPDEAMHLAGPKKNSAGDIVEPGEMVINVSGFAPIRGRQPLYFKDPTFLARAKVKAPAEGDVLTGSRGVGVTVSLT